MGFRLRSLRLGLLTVLLVAMTAIPSAWYSQAPGTAFGPVACWAGGTPDETLHPQPTPTSGKRTIGLAPRAGDYSKRPDVASNARIGAGGPVNSRDRLIAIWTFVRAMSLRH
ncbi:MAG TPA: hypothetical protein VFS09_07850 [Candidatus Eisenbacteria bacterium]|nr:hypothetical protein [Candidatus Eisenbacteria bacterium]